VTVTALVLLALVAAVGLLLTGAGERRRPVWGAVVLALLLAAAGAVAWVAGPASEGVAEGAALAAVLAHERAEQALGAPPAIAEALAACYLQALAWAQERASALHV
jgi:hypothetical protein